MDHVRLIRASLHPILPDGSWRGLAGVGMTVFLFLMLYCLGHGLVTAEPLDVPASVRWSLAYGCGAAAGWWMLRRLCHAPFVLRALSGSAAALAISAMIFIAVNGDPDAAMFLLNYVPVTVLCAVSFGAAGLVSSRVGSGIVTVDLGTRRVQVAIDDVIAIRGARNYAEVTAHGLERPALIRVPLKQLRQRYAGSLLQVHRSYVINPAHVAEIEEGQRQSLALQMVDGSKVPVSPSHRDLVIAAVHSSRAG